MATVLTYLYCWLPTLVSEHNNLVSFDYLLVRYFGNVAVYIPLEKLEALFRCTWQIVVYPDGVPEGEDLRVVHAVGLTVQSKLKQG